MSKQVFPVLLTAQILPKALCGQDKATRKDRGQETNPTGNYKPNTGYQTWKSEVWCTVYLSSTV